MDYTYINVITAFLFVIVSIIITLSLFYIEQDKKNLYKSKNSMQQEYRNIIDDSIDSDDYINKQIRLAIRKQPIRKIIQEDDRIKFITRCNRVDKELEGLLSKQMILYNQAQKNNLLEKRLYINKIRDIVNDLAFNNKKEFEQLYTVLKEIQKDVTAQNTRIAELEKKVSTDEKTKNELTNMMIQRMVHESSKKSLKKPDLSELLKNDADDKEDELKLLEKYIIKTIRKQVNKEKDKINEKSQEMNPISNLELHRKSELIDIMNQKLKSMESLYKNMNSENKKQIISIVKEPVKKAVQSYIRVEEVKPKCSKKNNSLEESSIDETSIDLANVNNDLKMLRKDGEANAFYVTN